MKWRAKGWEERLRRWLGYQTRLREGRRVPSERPAPAPPAGKGQSSKRPDNLARAGPDAPVA